jgi:hypothetical protein
MILHVEYPTLAVTVFPPKDTLRGVPHISCCCFPAKRYSTWSTTHQLLLFPRQKILHVESHASCYFSRQNLHHVEGHVSCYFFPPKTTPRGGLLQVLHFYSPKATTTWRDPTCVFPFSCQKLKHVVSLKTKNGPRWTSLNKSPIF